MHVFDVLRCRIAGVDSSSQAKLIIANPRLLGKGAVMSDE
jgi:hypothetical protein